MNKNKIIELGIALLILPFIYFGVCCVVFKWKNPLANDPSCFKEFKHVLKFEKLKKYQLPETIN